MERELRDIEDFLFNLYILEGVGLKDKNKAVVIVATLGDHKLETEIFQFSENHENIVFNSNLLWGTTKKAIKKMKSENIPIKVECHAVSWRNEQEVRTLIGYILLPVRGVPIPISMHKKPIEGKPHWHKLLGVGSEWRSKKPEILVYLGIDTSQNLLQENILKPAALEKLEHLPLDNRNTSSMLHSQQGLYIKLLQDEGLLQVGNSSVDCDIFIVKLMFKYAAHLEHIVNPEERMNKLFRLHYNLLGTPTYCSLIPKGDGIYNIQEKIAIHFKSSLNSLREYFDKVLYIPIDLYYNETIVGHTTFKFTDLIQHDDLTLFQELNSDSNNTLEQDGVFYIEPLFDLPPTASNPYVEFTFSLKYMSTAKIGNCEIIVDRPQIAEYIDNLAGGDNNPSPGKNQELPPVPLLNGIYDDNNASNLHDLRSVHSDSILFLSQHSQDNQNLYYSKYSQRTGRKGGTDVKLAKSVPGFVFKKSQIPSTNQAPNNDNTENTDQVNNTNTKTGSKIIPSQSNMKHVPRTFSYNLNLQSVKFKTRPEIGIWQISLHHLKSDTQFTIVNVELTEISSNFIEFKNLELQLYFSSTPQDILSIVESEPCILKIYGPNGVKSIAELDNEILLLHINDQKSGVILLEDEKTCEKIAIAHIFVYINDIGINFNTQFKKYTNNLIRHQQHQQVKQQQPLSPTTAITTQQLKSSSPYFDVNLAYKIVEELEEWKEKQQEQFLIELKRKEINHLANLKSEWKKRKDDQEMKLKDKLEQCSQLTQSLEEAYSLIKEKGYDQLEQTRIVEETRREYEQTYSIKMIEFNEKIRRLENDTYHQLKLEQLKYMELEMHKNQLEKENTKLKLEIDELKQKISEMQKTYLPREQLSGLFQDVRILSERLEEIQKSKEFYKDQWAKIIREVHKMKSDELRKMELHLKSTTSLGFREFLRDEQSELITEKDELDFVKRMLDSTANFIIENSNDDKNEKKPTDTMLIDSIC